MRYVLLIHYDERLLPEPGTPELEEEWARYDEFTREAGDRGLFETADALQPVATATTVRVREHETLVTDGPFAETKEQLGGFYVLDCADLDEAIEMAAKIPGARYGSIEIRPIIDYGVARSAEFIDSARERQGQR